MFFKLFSVLATHPCSSSMGVLSQGSEATCYFPFGLSVEYFPLAIPCSFHVVFKSIKNKNHAEIMERDSAVTTPFSKLHRQCVIK